MKVLVVDDEPAVRDAVGRALKLDGFEVTTAVDGRDAIRRLPDERPDAVLLDVLMPGLDGLEVCRRMRDVGDRTPVLMLTARDGVSDRVAPVDRRRHVESVELQRAPDGVANGRFVIDHEDLHGANRGRRT